MVAPISLIKGTGNIILSGGGGAPVTVIDNLTSTSKTDALSANMGRYLKELVDKPVEIDWYAISGRPSWIGSSKPTYTAGEVGAVAPRTEVSFTKVITTGGGFINQNSGYNVQMITDSSASQVWTDNKVLALNNWHPNCGGSGVRLLLGNNGSNLRGIWLVGDTKIPSTLTVGTENYYNSYGADVKFAVQGKSFFNGETIMANGILSTFAASGYARTTFTGDYYSINTSDMSKRLVFEKGTSNAIFRGFKCKLEDGIEIAGKENNGYVNSIITQYNNDGLLQNWYGANAAIRNALRFNWYDANFQIGVIRGGGQEIRAFGITYDNNELLAAFERSQILMFKDLSLRGSLILGGSNQINQHGDYSHIAINYSCQGRRKAVVIFNGVGGKIASFGEVGSDEITLNGRLELPDNGNSYVGGAMNDARCIQAYQQSQYSFHPVIVMKARSNARMVLGGIDNEMGFFTYTAERLDLGENGYDDRLIYHAYNRNWDIRCSNMINLDAPTVRVTGSLHSNGDVIAYSTSDRRLKKDIQQMNGGLAIIEELNPVTYHWDETNPINKHKDSGLEIGLIAQELQEILPTTVKDMYNGEYLGIDYKQLLPVLISAIKELNKKLKDNGIE